MNTGEKQSKKGQIIPKANGKNDGLISFGTLILLKRIEILLRIMKELLLLYQNLAQCQEPETVDTSCQNRAKICV